MGVPLGPVNHLHVKKRGRGVHRLPPTYTVLEPQVRGGVKQIGVRSGTVEVLKSMVSGDEALRAPPTVTRSGRPGQPGRAAVPGAGRGTAAPGTAAAGRPAGPRRTRMPRCPALRLQRFPSVPPGGRLG